MHSVSVLFIYQNDKNMKTTEKENVEDNDDDDGDDDEKEWHWNES